MTDFGGFSGESRIIASVVSGIALCFVVYKLTEFYSPRCFKAYGNLTGPQKIEWNNRGFSTAHAILVAIVSFYLLVLSSLFDEDPSKGLIVDRSSTLSNTLLGTSIGYFLTDIAMILWLYPALGGLEYVLHHGLSMFSIVLALISGQAQYYILLALFTETTTPIVNLRWYLDTAGLKGSRIYVLNGIALFFGWLIARVLVFVHVFYHMATHFEAVKTVSPVAFYSLLVVPPVLGAMNAFWFWKIAKGLIKTLAKAKKRTE